MHRVVKDQLKYEVHDDPYGEQVADGRHSASQEFSSMSRAEVRTEQVGRISRAGVSQTTANPQDDGNDWLQDEA